MAETHEDRSYSLGSFGNVRTADEQPHAHGHISRYVFLTRRGFVCGTVMYNDDTSEFDYSDLEFVFGGRLHKRTWRYKAYSQQYMVALAKRFAEEIAAKEG